ncbi:putative pyruvate dehydrogenase protein X component, mitochondrial [Golovinomyces cichoracearum]|uniref:Putative pyruvate dehydrogenase protein X component, mitochondrial n=1 Tax=Golovinomyces cichoracearum TaxID=62708 RepID=A0A420IJP1_9PEZI|nr:putative pyruvate dehydrogenase protein X component, mitochondrial [Golovinomyces cichoracearum]
MAYFLLSACSLSLRLPARELRRSAMFRGLRTSAARLIAQKLSMPALSPTMTEGNIAKWNVKEGDTFSAGDVLLEIETDKASMDVEAQDDGILAKIIQADGCKGIKVGTVIGILAEAGDDLKTLNIPLEESTKSESLQKKLSNPEVEPSHQKNSPPKSITSHTTQSDNSVTSVKRQSYPLLPSVQNLMRLHNLDDSTIKNMTPTGPNNRLLKGDVLAYLGHISASYPAQLSSKISHLSHLDLSNIKIREPPPASKVIEAVKPSNSKPETKVSLEQTVSLKNVHVIQEKIRNLLGVSLAEDVFIMRATNIANKNLPLPKSYKATSNELFESILGSRKNSTTKSANSRPFSPAIFNTSSALIAPVARSAKSKNYDIIDILSGKKVNKLKTNKLVESEQKTFKLEVAKDEEERARIFLDEIKTTLESRPESLVL